MGGYTTTSRIVHLFVWIASGFLGASPALAIVVLNTGDITSQTVGYNQSFDGVDLSGVVFIQSAGVGGCTGSLLADGSSILTAGHCVSNQFGGFVSPNVTVYFQGPNGLIPYTATSVAVNPKWDGNPTDGGDLAVIQLGALAPAFATRYQLDLDPVTYGTAAVIAGYGDSGTGVTGYDSTNFPGGTLRAGENAFVENGSALNSTWSANTLIGQFYDSSDPATNALGALHPFMSVDEVDLGPGDSGGPAFQNGEIVGINDFISCIGESSCNKPPSEYTSQLNSSFGQLFGNTSVLGIGNENLNFIEAQIVPEPGTLALMIGAMIVSITLRLRRSASVAAANLPNRG